MGNEQRPGRVIALEPGLTFGPTRPTIETNSILLEQTTTPRESLTFDDIQEKLSLATNYSLTEKLIELFGFNSLNWQLIARQNAISAIFLGAPNNVNRPIGVDEALGIIELKSRAKNVSEGYLSDKQITPSSIKTSGVVMDTDGNIRILATSYSIENEDDENRLAAINLSVRDLELPPVERDIYLHDVYDDYSRNRLVISDLLEDQITSASIITKAMRHQTDGHTQVLSLFRAAEKLYIPLSPHGDYPNPGFHIVCINDIPTIKFDPSMKGRSRLLYEHPTDPTTIPPWEISIPAKLDPS